MSSIRLAVLLIACMFLLTACGDDSSSNTQQNNQTSTKTPGEKANILLKHVTGKETTVIDDMNTAVEQYNDAAMNEMLPEDLRNDIKTYSSNVSQSLAGYEKYLEQLKALASKLNTDELKKLVTEYSSQLSSTQTTADKLKTVDSQSKFNSLKNQLDGMLAKLADLKDKASKFDSGKAMSDGIKGLMGN